MGMAVCKPNIGATLFALFGLFFGNLCISTLIAIMVVGYLKNEAPNPSSISINMLALFLAIVSTLCTVFLPKNKDNKE